MEAIEDIMQGRKLVESTINEYGSQAEHNFMHYSYKDDGYAKNVFLLSGNGKHGLMANVTRRGIWRLIAEPLAPREKYKELMFELFDYALDSNDSPTPHDFAGKHKGNGKKVFLELTEDVTKEIKHELAASKKYRGLTNNFILYWPVYNLKAFDQTLPGKDWKKLRNVLNAFTKSHKVEVIPSKEVGKEKLREMILEWRKNRAAKDSVNNKFYLQIIDSGFEGFDMARTVMVDGKPCSITGGWKIPNTKGYYSSLGIINYACDGLGEYANIDDLGAIKALGCEFADFGGSDLQLLSFKKKFKPEKIYKTYIFGVVKR
jgi:hypothetical protein